MKISLSVWISGMQPMKPNFYKKRNLKGKLENTPENILYLFEVPERNDKQ